MSDQETIQWIIDSIPKQVRGGFVTEEKLLEDLQERIEDEIKNPPNDLFTKLQALVSLSYSEQRDEERGWQEPTFNDAIDAAFETLNRLGIVALQNAGYTMTEGWEDVNEVAASLATWPRGAVFYHGQDLERGVEGHGLLLTFGAYEQDEGRHEAASLDIARETVNVLSRYGIAANWDGTIERRIEIPPFSWQKRQFD